MRRFFVAMFLVCSFPVAAHATTKYWSYVANADDDTIDIFETSSTTGFMTWVDTVEVDGSPVSLAVYNNGSNNSEYLYVVLGDVLTVVTYAIDATDGTLSQGGSVSTTGTPYWALVVTTLYGSFLYVSNPPLQGNNYDSGIDIFGINTGTGKLTPIDFIDTSGIPLKAGHLSSDPAGKWLYATQEPGSANGRIGGFSIDASTGALTHMDSGGNPSPWTVSGGTFEFQFTNLVNKYWGWLSCPSSNRLDRYSVNSTTGYLTHEESWTTGISTPRGIDYISGRMFVVNAGAGALKDYNIDNDTGEIDSSNTVYGGFSVGQNVRVDRSFGYVQVTDTGTSPDSVAVSEINAADTTEIAYSQFSAGDGAEAIAVARTQY
jgi:6-phosphogluconolactonase (cycloisomerase 2 family)